jgi:hypothetical protein
VTVGSCLAKVKAPVGISTYHGDSSVALQQTPGVT